MDNERTWEADWYREGDKERILEMNRAEYGNSALSNGAHLDWLENQNPAGPAIFPVAREKGSGRVVGFALYLPVMASWSGRCLPATLGANLLVDPAYRRQGIYETIVAAAFEKSRELGYHLWYVYPNPKSLMGHKKWGDIVVARIQLLVRPLDIEELAEARLGNQLLRWSASAGWKIAGNTIWREQYSKKQARAFQVTEDAELDDGYDRFWERIATKYNLMVMRNRSYLQWRFRDIPSRSYRFLSARRNGEMVGYAVLLETAIRGISCGLIADLMVLPDQVGDQAGACLVHEATARFRQAELAVEGGLFLPHSQEYSLLRRAGYLPCPELVAPQPFHLVVRNLSGIVSSRTLASPETWFVSLADHDAV